MKRPRNSFVHWAGQSSRAFLARMWARSHELLDTYSQNNRAPFSRERCQTVAASANAAGEAAIETLPRGSRCEQATDHTGMRSCRRANSGTTRQCRRLHGGQNRLRQGLLHNPDRQGDLLVAGGVSRLAGWAARLLGRRRRQRCLQMDLLRRPRQLRRHTAGATHTEATTTSTAGTSLSPKTARLKHPGFDAHLFSCDRCASRSGGEA